MGKETREVYFRSYLLSNVLTDILSSSGPSEAGMAMEDEDAGGNEDE